MTKEQLVREAVKWDAETWDGFGKGELHNRSTAKEIHEEIAS
ncbi:hypothetical protein [Bacillus cereus group sp. BfR-BA-01383]|nr:hypothetical protein [Bacillus cereus group sp. BfR-BA-01383]